MSSNLIEMEPINRATRAFSDQLRYTQMTEGQVNEFEEIHQRQISSFTNWMKEPCDGNSIQGLLAGENDLHMRLQGIRTYTFPPSVNRVEEALQIIYWGILIRVQLLLAKAAQSLPPESYDQILEAAAQSFPDLRLLEFRDTANRTASALNGEELSGPLLNSLIKQYYLLQAKLEEDYRESLARTGICTEPQAVGRTPLLDCPHHAVAERMLSNFALRAEASPLIFQLNASSRESFDQASRRFREMQAQIAQQRESKASEDSWTSRILRFFRLC